MGGHGRTGTAIATLMVLTKRMTGKAAIKKVKKMYCDKAIETLSQQQYVIRVGELAGRRSR